jgi:hypothetical protein
MNAVAAQSISDSLPVKKQQAEAAHVSGSTFYAQPVSVFEGAVIQRKERCACGGGCPRCAEGMPFQAKLAVSQPGDVYEQEADRIADEVTRKAEPSVQRSCASCAEGSSTCPTCKAEEAVPIQRKAGNSSGHSQASVPESFLLELGSGQPLDEATRTFMESSFKHDFSSVQVHTDARAAESARSVNALAYTIGRDIVFASGQFSPQTTAGRRLLAHELTHTIQQGAVKGGGHLSQGQTVARSLQRAPADAAPSPESGGASIYDEAELTPEPADAENYVVGNTMDMVSIDSPAEEMLASPANVPKAPDEAAGKKGKMGGPLGPVPEGMGQPGTKLSPECKEWIKLKRTTYPYDPGKNVDPLETEFLTTYKDFKEGVPIAKPGDFNEKLKAATENPCTCLETLNVDGHGGSWSGGAQEFAPRKFTDLGKRSFGVKKDKKGKIVPYNFQVFDGLKFCKPCAIRLGGCYVALNEPKAQAGTDGFKGAGDALGKALAAKTGCSVSAYTELTTTSKPGEFAGGAGGKWVTTEPEKKP